VSRPVRIAVAQYEPHVGELEQNRSQAVLWATSAAEQGADLIVLPELASSGYVFDGEAEAQRSAEDPDDGPTVRALREVCAMHGCHIVAGISERDGECRHNSAVLVGPPGEWPPTASCTCITTSSRGSCPATSCRSSTSRSGGSA